ncbi:MAG: GAF domain-containing protein [Vicinamibacterales bacterium]
MSFDDRVRSTVDQALGSLVQQLLAQALEERETAVREARAAVFAESEDKTLARVADAETRVKAFMEDAVRNARVEERDLVSREVRSKVEAEFEPKLSEAVANADARARVILADAQAKAADEMKAAVAQARVREREIEMSGVTRLLESVRGLDGATTLSEVLDALALAAAREAARAAVVVLRGERISGWRLSGFGPRDSQPKSIDLPLADAGVIGLAIATARAVTTRDSESAAVGPGFEKIPPDRMGLAVPVVVGGRVVAVAYADAVTLDGHERPVPSSWPELLEVLARHAGRCLEALTVQRTQPPKVAGSTGPGSAGTTGSTPDTTAGNAGVGA